MPTVLGQQTVSRNWRAADPGDGYLWRFDGPGLTVLAIDSATQGGEVRYVLPDASWVSLRLSPSPTGQAGSISGDTLTDGPVALQIQEVVGVLRASYIFTAQTKSQSTYNWTVATGAGPSGRSATFTLLANGSGELRDGTGQLAYTQLPPTATDRNGAAVSVTATFSTNTLTYTPADIQSNRYPLALDPTTVSTTTSASALVSNNSPHIYTMSNGDEAAIYFDGTNWAYRVKASGTWGSATTLGTLPTTGTHLSGASCRNGDTLFFGAGSYSANTRIAKLVYNTGTQTFTVTYTADTADPGPVVGLYSDGTKVHMLFLIANTNAFCRAFTQSSLANAINAASVTGAPADAQAEQVINYCLVGDGTTTFYAVMNGGAPGSTVTNITKLVAGASSYTQTAETGVTAAALGLWGIFAVYDGTNIVFVANENNAKLRYMTRTAANTYSAWTDLDTHNLGDAPAVTLKSSNGDLGVAYKRTSSQVNGEIYTVLRLSSTWGTPTLLAGSASTGWQMPTAAPSDANESAGVVRLVYLTGTGSPWSIIEDTYTISSGVVPSITQGSAGPLGASASISSVGGKGAWTSIRPIADVSTGTWTDQSYGTSDLHSPIGEQAIDDTTYDQAGWATSDVLEERLHAFSIPSPANNYTFSYRYNKDYPEGQRVDLQVELRQGASTQVAVWTHTSISGTVTEVNQALSAPQIALITDPRDVRVRVTQTRFQTP